MTVTESKISKVLTVAILAMVFSLAAIAQSTDPNFPSPVTSNEINGTINARDIGDSRLTRYFYAFEGGQGDIFLNVVTKNFSGDIDVFTADALRPLTKMVIYAEAGTNETGRLIYMRQGERLILRIEGRSPNDDPATFRIKFGGSFVALAGETANDAPKVINPGETNDSGVRVNSVGTIVAVIPKPQPVKPPKTIAKTVGSVKGKKPKKSETPKALPEPERSISEPPASLPEPVEPKTDSETKTDTIFENDAAKVTVEPTEAPVTKPPVKAKAPAKAKKSKVKPPKPPAQIEEPKPDPLASVRLVIQLKDGTVIERPMSEVAKFTVDKGVLVVTPKDGKTVRYSIFDVAKVTIE